VVQGGNSGEDAAGFGGGQDDGEFGLAVGPGQLKFVGPGAFEGFLPEDLESADDLGGGLAGDLFVGFEMDAILSELFGGDEVRGFAVELAQLSQAGKVGLFGAGADGQELEVIGERF
jgi:hypothetical protein